MKYDYQAYSKKFEAKNPKRKWKNNCEVCGKNSCGKRCQKCFDDKRFNFRAKVQQEIWTDEFKREHSDLMLRRNNPNFDKEIENIRKSLERVDELWID